MAIYQYFGTESAISELPAKILTSPVDCRDHNFLKESSNSAMRRRLYVSFTVQVDNLSYFYFRSIWPNDLKHVSPAALRTGITFTKFEVDQPIRARLLTFLLHVGIACYADGCITYGRPSVTRWYCVETNEATIMRFSPWGRTIILVSAEAKIVWKFAGDHP